MTDGPGRNQVFIIKAIMRQNKKPWDRWTDEEIIWLFDTNLNATLEDLSFITMRSVQELKLILIQERNLNGTPKAL